MKDSVILGTGNSRYLKSVENFKTMYPTYDDFAAALVAGTLPVDFNGINTAGFQQIGDGLGKNTLLKDATAALLGGDASMLPDEALSALIQVVKNNYSELSSLANSKARFELGTYTGNGNTTRTFTCSFKPVLLILTQTYANPVNAGGVMAFVRCDVSGTSGYSFGGKMFHNKPEGNSVTISTNENASEIANSAQNTNTDYLLKWNYCFIG